MSEFADLDLRLYDLQESTAAEQTEIWNAIAEIRVVVQHLADLAKAGQIEWQTKAGMPKKGSNAAAACRIPDLSRLLPPPDATHAPGHR